MRNVTQLLGLSIDRLTQASFLDQLENFVLDGKGHTVLYANAACVNQALRDRRYAQILQEADLVCADGMGVVWVSRLTSEPLPERVNVGDMIGPLCALSARKSYKLFLLGGAPGIAERTAATLQQQFPGLIIAGTHHGFFGPEHDAAIIKDINQVKPHLVLVGMGVPKQEKWIWQHRQELEVPVLWGVGAAFEYHAGVTPRAPVWVRSFGLEWAFRLIMEPHRLWRRYVFGNAFFVFRTLALLLIDAGLVTVAWFGAYAICRSLEQPFGSILNPIEPYLNAVGLMVATWLVTCAGFGLYRRSATMSALSELGQVIRATWIGLLSTIAVAFFLREWSIGRPVVVLAGLLTFMFLLTSRLLTRVFEQRLARRGIGLRRTLIIGTDALAKRLKQEIEIWPIGYDVLGFVRNGEREHAVDETEIVGSIEELGVLIHAHQIHDVFVASQSPQLHQELNLLATHEPWAVNFHVVSGALESFAQRIPLERVIELPLLDLPPLKARTWYEVNKRIFDMAIAIVGLVVMLPLGILIACLVTLESTGPVLFVQERVGRAGHLFRMYKFRTMMADAPVYDVAPNDLTDARVTRVGRILRRWSLDELPQLINVLQGQMTLVGPRPEMPFLVEQYQPWQRQRLSVRPGLTGLWQIMGRKELPLHSHIEYDLYYVRHRDWLLDLAILLKTAPAVLFRRGAF